MKVKLTSVYNNIALPDTDFQGDYGNATIIEAENQVILYDTGNNGDILLHNLKSANININAINPLVLSHGHNDHTRGLEKLLQMDLGLVIEQFLVHLKKI